jgi:hypothetical protein
MRIARVLTINMPSVARCTPDYHQLPPWQLQEGQEGGADADVSNDNIPLGCPELQRRLISPPLTSAPFLFFLGGCCRLLPRSAADAAPPRWLLGHVAPRFGLSTYPRSLLQSHLCTAIARCDFPGAPSHAQQKVLLSSFSASDSVLVTYVLTAKRRGCQIFATLRSGGPLADDRQVGLDRAPDPGPGRQLHHQNPESHPTHQRPQGQEVQPEIQLAAAGVRSRLAARRHHALLPTGYSFWGNSAAFFRRARSVRSSAIARA